MVASIPFGASDPELAGFVRSMPPAYAALFSEAEMHEHLQIVRARGARDVHAALCRTAPSGLVAVCIVAEDRPGLLSVVASALVMHRLDVKGAQVFCRKMSDGRREAVDLFWLRSFRAHESSRAIDGALVSGVERTISELLSSHCHSVRAESPRVIRPSEPLRLGPRVYLDVRALQRGECTLVVEALDRPGLLLDVSRTLFRLGIETIATEVRVEDGVAHHRFGLSVRNGTRLTAEEMARVRAAVLRMLRDVKLPAAPAR
jgi:UTP:GlnB (protein PII) uridylyltransferase